MTNEREQSMGACTTLNRIREHSPCKSGWEKLLRHLGKTAADDELLPFSVIVESNGLDDALWCCRSVAYDRAWRMYAVWCARQVQHLMEDQRSLDALDVAEQFVSGIAIRGQFTAARDAARDAAWAAAWSAAWSAAEDAARAAQKAMFLRVVSCASEGEAVEMLRKEMHP